MYATNVSRFSVSKAVLASTLVCIGVAFYLAIVGRELDPSYLVVKVIPSTDAFHPALWTASTLAATADAPAQAEGARVVSTLPSDANGGDGGGGDGDVDFRVLAQRMGRSLRRPYTETVAGAQRQRCTGKWSAGCSFEELTWLEVKQKHDSWRGQSLATKALCEAIDPEHDYSAWLTPTYYKLAGHFPHGEFNWTLRWPEAYHREMNFGQSQMNSHLYTLRRGISSLLGDTLSHGEPNSMSLVRLLLLGRGKDFRWEHPPLVGSIEAIFQTIYWNITFHKLGSEIQPVPGLSEAAATCRARLFMDSTINRGPLNLSQAEHPQDYMWYMGYEPDYDQVYATTWPGMGRFYGNEIVTLRPDFEHRTMSTNEFWDEFPDLVGEAGKVQLTNALITKYCFDVRETFIPVYMEPGATVKFEFVLGPTIGGWPWTTLEYGLYKISDEELPSIGLALHWDSSVAGPPTSCVTFNAGGLLVSCISLGHPTIPGWCLSSDPPSFFHSVITEEVLAVAGILYSVPLDSDGTSSHSPSSLAARCVAARALRRQLALASNLTEILNAPPEETWPLRRFREAYTIQASGRPFVDGSATIEYLPSTEIIGPRASSSMSEEACQPLIDALRESEKSFNDMDSGRGVP